MKRVINSCLLLTSGLGYLEWGQDHSLFIFQAEVEIFLKARQDLRSIMHPLIIVPFLGQLILLFTIFQRKVSRRLSLLGLASISTILLLLLVVGILSFNLKIIGSTLPFIIAGILLIRHKG